MHVQYNHSLLQSTHLVYLNCDLHHCYFLQLLTYKQHLIHNCRYIYDVHLQFQMPVQLIHSSMSPKEGLNKNSE